MGMIVNPYTGAPAGGDLDYGSTVLICDFEGADGSSVYTDYSPIANDPISGGNTQVSTTAPIRGTSSLACTAGRIGTTALAAYLAGTGAMTFEFLMKTATPTQVSNIADYGGLSTHALTGFVLYTLSSSIHLYMAGADKIVGGTIIANTEHAIAVTKVPGTIYLLFDGVLIGSAADTTNLGSGATPSLWLGGTDAGASSFTGTMDEWRVTIGVARYTANYTPNAGTFAHS